MTITVAVAADRAGLANFFSLYAPIADTWQMLDNSAPAGPRPIAVGPAGRDVEVVDTAAWENRVALAAAGEHG